MTSLRKIAALAGVSPSTVTRALRDDPRIGAKTRASIQKLAAQCHYLPNRLTQSLMTGCSQTIGVLVPSVITPYSAEMLAGILGHATETGYRVIVKESHGLLTESLAAIQTFIEQRVDGVLLDTGHLEPIPRKTLLEMRSHQVIPVGLDATTCEGELDQVHTDEQALALAAVDYLLRLGHSRIAFIGRTVHGQWVGRGAHIARAFQQRLLTTRHFIDINEAPPYTNLPVTEIMTRLLGSPSPPTALIAWEDPLAALFIKEAMRQGFRVPGDLSVLGFGNLAFGTLMTPALTTFEQHAAQVGGQAAGILISRLAGVTDRSEPYRSIAIAPSLIVRQSCASINSA